jgi:lipoate synthase
MRAIALDDIRQALGTITKQIPFFAKKDVQLKLETEVTESKKDLFTQLETQQNYVERLLKDVERNMNRVEKNQGENQQTLSDNLETVKRIELTIQSMRRNNAGGALKQKLTMMSQANQQQNESQDTAEGG